jgi:hypothetical protein
MRPRHHARNSTRRQPGFDNRAINYTTNAVREDCRTSTWAHSASTPPCSKHAAFSSDATSSADQSATRNRTRTLTLGNPLKLIMTADAGTQEG